MRVPLRLLALLVTFGMLVISTQAPDLQPAAETSALVDTTDDLAIEVVAEPSVLPVPAACVVELPTLVSQPPGYRHELSVFRPPRAALA